MAITHTGTTALVTGASSGLGEEFARQLATRGANLVLVARRAAQLERVAAEVRKQYGVTVTVIELDLARPDAGEVLAERVRSLGLTVDTVINNAGFGTRQRFEDEDPARLRQEIALNVAALVDITRSFYPELLSRGRGALINIASTAAYQPVPVMAVYAATKAFVLRFTEALWYEAKGSGLKVLAMSPGATQTEFFQHSGEGAAMGAKQTPQQVVALALATIDRRSPPPSIISGMNNRVMSYASRLFLPRAAVSIAGMTSGRKPTGK